MPDTRKPELDALAIGLLLACCMFWGFQQVLIKSTVAEVPPVFQAFLRFAIATTALLLWCVWRKIPLLNDNAPRGSRWGGLLAGTIFAAEFAALYIGLQFTQASRITVFLYCAPFWVAVILPRFVSGEGLRGWQWLGLGGAFVGAVVAMGDGLLNPAALTHPLSWLGDLLGLVAGLMWGLTTVVIRSTPLGQLAPAKQLLYQIGVSTAVLPVLSLALGEHWSLDLSMHAWVSLLLQSLVGAFATYLAWVWMLAHYSATKMSSFTFLSPVFALLFGVLLLGEAVTPGLLLALALVALGIFLVNRKPRLKA